MTKFNFEGLNISIDPQGKFVIDSIYDDKGNTVSLEDVGLDEEDDVIVSNEEDDDATDEKETNKD